MTLSDMNNHPTLARLFYRERLRMAAKQIAAAMSCQYCTLLKPRGVYRCTCGRVLNERHA